MAVLDWEVAEPVCHAPHIGHVATSRADGAPHVVPIWLDAAGDELLLNTTEGSAKLRHLRRDPRVAVSIHASSEPFLAVTILGRVVAEETGERAVAHIDELSVAYDGQPWAFVPGERERRVLLHVRPERVICMTEDGAEA